MAQRKTNALRDASERASSGIVRLLDQARSKALRADFAGATSDIRDARQAVIQICLQYESKLMESQAAQVRAQASAALAERQLQSMRSFADSTATEGKPAAQA